MNKMNPSLLNPSSHTIRKAVFPVAGMGTRFLPATKANPKEMMPIVDKPLIQYAVEEAILAGIKELIFVTSSTKRAIEDHFDSHYELESRLEAKGKDTLLSIVRNVLPQGVHCVYIRQPEALGLGHAILCAKNVVGNEPFAVLLADDLIDHDHSDGGACLKQMVEAYEKTKQSILGIEKIDPKQADKYGIVGFADNFQGFGEISTIIEKPSPALAPSSYAVVGRYILTPGIFTELSQAKPSTNSEIQLTDAIEKLLSKEKVYGFEFLGKRYDCGDKLGYLEAIVAYGLKHPEVGPDFQQYLRAIQTVS